MPMVGFQVIPPPHHAQFNAQPESGIELNKKALSQLAVGNEEEWSLGEKQTVGGRDAAVESTGISSRRVCARPDSTPMPEFVHATHHRDSAIKNGPTREGESVTSSMGGCSELLTGVGVTALELGKVVEEAAGRDGFTPGLERHFLLVVEHLHQHLL